MNKRLIKTERAANRSSVEGNRDHFKKGASPKSHTSRRHKRSLVIFACLLLFSSFSTYAQESKLRIAVIDIYDACNEKKDDRYFGEINSAAAAKEITSILTTKLVNTNKYRVVERSRIEQIIKEQGFQSTQEASVRAVELGKLLGVKKIITGEYSGTGDRYQTNGTTSVRLIDVESGEIEAAITFENRYKFYENEKDRKHNRYYLKSLSIQEIAKKIVLELL